MGGDAGRRPRGTLQGGPNEGARGGCSGGQGGIASWGGGRTRCGGKTGSVMIRGRRQRRRYPHVLGSRVVQGRGKLHQRW